MAEIEPLVSIIVPAYNAQATIEHCIQSCIEQHHTRIEIIVINDGSTDDTLSIVRSFNDKRLILIDQLNQGCSQAKNTGLSRATGKFIQYLDADDYLSPDKIKSQVEQLRNNPFDIAVCKTVNVDESGEGAEIDTNLISKGGTGIEFLLRLWGSEGKRGMVQPNAYLISRELAEKIGTWDETISPNPDEDGEYFSRALLAANRVRFTTGVNYYRTSNSNSLSKTISPIRLQKQLSSIDKTFSSILCISNDKSNKDLLARAVTSLVYENHREQNTLIPSAKEILAKHSIDDFLIVYPRKFALISKFFGFEKALAIRRLLKKIM